MSDVEIRKARTNGTLKPFTMLIVFTFVNFLTYFDRGALAASLKTLEDKDIAGINKLEAGFLGGAYMFGYAGASPFFAQLAHRYRPLKLMAIGLFMWALAAVGTGMFIQNYWGLLFSRALSGVGEASFLCLAPPFIDKNAPPEKRSSWLSIFFVGIPLGYAFGAGSTGYFLEKSGIGKAWALRWVFLFEGVLMLPFVAFCGSIDADHLTFTSESNMEQKLLNAADSSDDYLVTPPGESSSVHDNPTFKQSLSVLWGSGAYLCIVFAYSAQTFVVGGFAFWGVTYVTETFEWSEGKASLTFGLLTAGMGIIGSVFGGWNLDRLRRGNSTSNTHNLEKALRLITTISILALPSAIMAFYLADYGPGFFFALLGFSEFLMFAAISPINSAIMWSVPFQYNPIAIAMSVVSTHALGDAISPFAIGGLLDATGDDYSLVMMLASGWLIWSVLGFSAGWAIAHKKAARSALLGYEVSSDAHIRELDPKTSAGYLVLGDDSIVGESDDV